VGRYALINRFPGRARFESSPIVEPADRAEHPALEPDFAQLDEIVVEPFRKSDVEALKNQNAYRWQQVVIIIGSALVSVLGAFQAAYSGWRGWGVAVVLASGAVAAAGKYAKDRNSLKNFLSSRMQAERLRGEYFWFLARIKPYDSADRVAALRHAVANIQRGEEPR
jgi:hypothetical protein